jgi:hypothetical protein
VRLTTELHAKDWESFLFVTGLMDEAHVPWAASGGNVVRVPDNVFVRLSPEQLGELAGVVRNAVQVQPDPKLRGVLSEVPADASPGASSGPAAASAAVAAAPPRSGAGATRDAWAAHARRLGLTPDPGASRDDIIAMIDQQEAPGGS